MFNIYTKKLLYNVNDKENLEILSKPKANLIKKSVFYEYTNQFLIIFVIGDHDLIFYNVKNQNDSKKNYENSELNLKNLKENVIVKKFPAIKEHGEIRDICFNSSGDILYILFEQGIIIALPLTDLIDQFTNQNNTLKVDANLICSKSIFSPSNIIVWYSFDGEQEIAIISNDLGELCFINIDKKQIIKKTSIKKSIKNLRIIRDKFTVTLLITALDNTQLKLPLEENRLSLILNQDNDADNIKFMEENRFKLFSCFIINKPQQSFDEEKINIKPVEIDLKKKDNENISCILVNQQSFILATYTLKNKNFTSINIYEGNEFTYEFTTPLSKYIFPKECVSLENVVELVTERLIITANLNLLYIISKQCSDFKNEKAKRSIISCIEFESNILNIFHLNENYIDYYLDTLIVITNQCAYKLIPKMNCEKMFVELLNIDSPQFSSLLINPTKSLISEKNIKLNNLSLAQEFGLMLRLTLNDLYIKAMHFFLQNKQCQKVFDLFCIENIPNLVYVKNLLSHGYNNEVMSIIIFLFEEKSYDLDDQDKISIANIYVACSIKKILDKKVINKININKLKNFLLKNIYYDENYVIKLLVSSCMFELAQFCAMIRNNFSTLIKNLLNVEKLQRDLLSDSFYEKINQSSYNDVLIEPIKNIEYYKSLLSEDILEGFFVEPELISKFLKTLIEALPKFNKELLDDASRLLDPRKPKVQLFLNNVVNKYNQKYIYYLDTEDQCNIQKKDIINFFILVNFIIFKNEKKNLIFDERILKILNSKKIDSNELVRQNIQHDELQDEYLVSCGQLRSFFIKSGNLYSWGSSIFGADGNHKSENLILNNSPIINSEPKLNTYFSEKLSIKVIGVSSGAYHSLFLTKLNCYAVGQSIYGQLGCGNTIQYTKNPKAIEDLQFLNVQKLVCGQYHSFAVTNNGQIYSWGWGVHGQLGHGNTDNVYKPKKIKYFKNKKVIDVCGGYCHSIVLDDQGIVYSFGNNVYGQLGIENCKKKNIPVQIYLVQEKIDLISSNYFHTLAFSKSSKCLYCWGSSPQNIQFKAQQCRKMRPTSQNSGESLLENNFQESSISSNSELPRIISYQFDIKKISTGNLHSILLTQNGLVYSWGRGPDGQLGQGCLKIAHYPALIQCLKPTPFVDIACGYDFSLCVNENGELYSFGQNMDYQLGLISKADPKKNLNILHSSLNLIDMKKYKYKNKKVLAMLSCKQVEKKPVKIEFKKDLEQFMYLDSVNTDITNFKLNDEIDIRKENCELSEIDNFTITNLIFMLRHELNLNVILKTSLSLDNYSCSGFIYEILKKPLEAFNFYLKNIFESNSKINEEILNENITYNQVKEVLSHFILKYLSVDKKIFQSIILELMKMWQKFNLSSESLEKLLLEFYLEKEPNFIFGLYLFELMENENISFNLSNEFKINLIKTTKNYLESAKINEFLVEPVTSLISLMSDNENLLSAEKLWKDILNDIQKELEKNQLDIVKKKSSYNLKEEKSDELYEGVEIIPEDNEIFVFSCSHHFNTDYYNKILLKQLEIINKESAILNSENNSESQSSLDKNFPNKCPLCSNN